MCSGLPEFYLLLLHHSQTARISPESGALQNFHKSSFLIFLFGTLNHTHEEIGCLGQQSKPCARGFRNFIYSFFTIHKLRAFHLNRERSRIFTSLVSSFSCS